MAFAFCACGGFAQNLIQNGDFTQVKHTGTLPGMRDEWWQSFAFHGRKHME